MRPGTPHFVVTLEDCLAVGGHFFSMCTMQRTLRSLLAEHYLGNVLTNTMLETAPLILLKLFEFCHRHDPSGQSFYSLLGEVFMLTFHYSRRPPPFQRY